MDSRVRNFLKAEKPNPRGSGLKRVRITVKQRGREGPNVGFPALTHDRVAGSELGTEYLLPPAQSASSYASAFFFWQDRVFASSSAYLLQVHPRQRTCPANGSPRRFLSRVRE